MASTAVSSPPPHANNRSSSTSANVSYETFAPRSTAQVARLSRIAALTAGPTARAAAVAYADQIAAESSTKILLEAMCPPPLTAIHEGSSVVTNGVNDDHTVKETLAVASDSLNHMTNVLKHTTSLRLALRASINIAEDISNRHAELLRHSGELSAAADRLQAEEEILTRHAEEIGMPLRHYDAVDQIGVQVGVLFKGKAVVRGLAKIKVDNDDFPTVLDQIDDAVEFFGRESGGKEALAQAERRQRQQGAEGASQQLLSGNIEYFRRSLALQEAALSLIREAVADRITQTAQDVAAAFNTSKVPIPADTLEASLAFTRFHGISSRSNRLLTIVRKKIHEHRGEVYQELLQLCRNTYCQSRASLLQYSVRSHLDKLKNEHGLVGMTRLASLFLIRLCTVETSLYLDFFGDKKTAEVMGDDSEQTATGKKKMSTTHASSFASQVMAEDGTYYDNDFQSYLTNLCSALHRTVRRGLVTVLDLDTLCQVVSVLREERSMASSSPTTMAAARAISSVIEDAQERLIFSANTYLTKEVVRFKATPADLNYPDKLRRKESEPSGGETDGAAAAASTSDDDVVQQQLQVYEAWFPPMRSVLRILSKIFRVVEPRVFEDIALQSVQACTRCLKDGATYIKQKSGVMHSDLFLVKHLLVS